MSQIIAPSTRIYDPSREKPPFEITQRYGLDRRNAKVSVEGLVAYYLMNEGAGSIVQDLSGNGNNGVFVANPLWVYGQSGPAIDFSDDAINVGDVLGTEAGVTIVCKFRWDGGGNSYNRIIDSYPGPSIVLNSPTGILGFYGKISGVTKDLSWTTAIAVSGETATWAFRLGNNLQECYKNGVLVDGALSAATGEGTYDDNGAVNMYIGNRESDMGRDYDGLIEYVYVYNRALSAGEILQLSRKPFCQLAQPRLIVNVPVAVSGGINMPLVMQQMNQFNGGQAA